ncbi:hypothetical protein [Paenibacillus sp. NEAU-GSW1]|uniref:hypothetical protein n=1 Tax=Paenibacillus sp. NEAU-GSW1 TaxID=2682486 RepID=UPI0012E1674B|nr:hypothetical protein [Paenibacillus sp. NEAU-GSW1]MUT65072.1 hypothetical protein [Paenibacillus sp. NEAU-GSW1]
MAAIAVVVFAILVGFVICKYRLGLKQKREAGWALFIMSAGSVYWIGIILSFPVPNPLDWITAVFGPFASAMKDMLY